MVSVELAGALGEGLKHALAAFRNNKERCCSRHACHEQVDEHEASSSSICLEDAENPSWSPTGFWRYLTWRRALDQSVSLKGCCCSAAFTTPWTQILS